MNTAIEQNVMHSAVRTTANSPSFSASAVSWGAILAGAAAAAALSLILLILGTGLGLSSVSPWTHVGVSAGTFGATTILWLTLTQLAAAGLGGYLTGRLRTQWPDVHTDEVYFRDTAHGFLAWAIASLATAVLLTSTIGSILNGGVRAGASMASGVATTAMMVTANRSMAEMDANTADSGAMAYFLDSLFRRDTNQTSTPAQGTALAAPPPTQENATSMAEVTRIFLNAVRTNTLPADDLRHVGQVITERTGLTQQQAEQRVREMFTRLQTSLGEAELATRHAADSARKASAYAALWLFISLLTGAFVASFAAPYGGRQRDL